MDLSIKENYSFREISRQIDSGSRNRKREPIMVHKYPNLNSEVSNLKDMLNIYYEDYIREKFLKYGLLI